MKRFVRLNEQARFYGQNNLVQTETELKSIANSFKAFRDLRSQEQSLKIEVRNKIDELIEDIEVFEKLLPQKEESVVNAVPNKNYKMSFEEWGEHSSEKKEDEPKNEPEQKGIPSFAPPRINKKITGVSERKKSAKTILKEEIEEIKRRLQALRERLEQ